MGVGGVGIDYLASVATFPKPDQKLRTDMLGIQGGGNCGNSMTGVARLGLKSRILSTVGTDSLGDAVVSEFQEDGVSTEFLNRQEGAATPFTYIIVDESGAASNASHFPNQLKTRSCDPASAKLVNNRARTLILHSVY